MPGPRENPGPDPDPLSWVLVCDGINRHGRFRRTPEPTTRARGDVRRQPTSRYPRPCRRRGSQSRAQWSAVAAARLESLTVINLAGSATLLIRNNLISKRTTNI